MLRDTLRIFAQFVACLAVVLAISSCIYTIALGLGLYPRFTNEGRDLLQIYVAIMLLSTLVAAILIVVGDHKGPLGMPHKT